MKLIKESFYNLLRQPVISSVTIIGTALSIFLIMVVVMIKQVDAAPFAPESNRDRMLHYYFISFAHKEWGEGASGNGAMSMTVVKDLFYTLKAPEAVTAYTGTDAKSVSLPRHKPFTADVRETDADYFKVFDFTFLSGKPFSQAEYEAGLPLAVIDTNVASRLFGSEDAIGKEFLLNGGIYRVSGVVKPVSPLASNAYAHLWINTLSTDSHTSSWSTLGGPYSVTILAPSADGLDEVRADFNRRLDAYQKELGDYHIINRNRPYTQEKFKAGNYANIEPDLETAHRSDLILYTILLLVPAINLSSMTHSRLRRRVGEIAVMRAFGRTRMATFFSIINENLIVTLIGGMLGLICSVIMAMIFDSFIFAQPYTSTITAPTVNPMMLLHWSTFGWAVFFCFILNILSSGLPAFQMSRLPLVDSLRGTSNK